MIGPLTIARERVLRAAGVHLRVFVRGEDVTHRCRFADDTPGHVVAELFRHNARGRCYLDEDRRASVEVAVEDVEIRMVPR